MTASEPKTSIQAFPEIPAFLRPLAGLGRLAELYQHLRESCEPDLIPEGLLAHLEIGITVTESDLARVPVTGPTIIVANHPFGLLEGAVLAVLLKRIRPDVRFLGNQMLARIPELRHLLIPVDPIRGRSAAQSNGLGMRKVVEFLRDGGLVVIFPAGTVSHLQIRQGRVTDPNWNPSVARLINVASRRGARVRVVPTYIDGANSLTFQAAGLIHPRLRTALLARELLNKGRTKVTVRIGSPIDAKKLSSVENDQQRIDYLRWRTYLLARRRELKQNTSVPLKVARGSIPETVINAIDPNAMDAEISELVPVVASGHNAVYIARSSEIPNTMQEIGRLRETTFRAVGEGTNRSTDLDRFDEHYLHLFLWNHAKRELIGAYRLSSTVWGPHHLYTAQLFGYGSEFLEKLGPALELGRSFIREEYQRSFSALLLLWKGIGQYIARNPRYQRLFGAVSISNRYQAISRELIVSYLESRAYLANWTQLLSTRSKVRMRSTLPLTPHQKFDLDDLSDVVNDVESGREGVPVLLRQYLRLGGKLLGFNVDPEFNEALDGLIVVDLTQTEPKLLERYLGQVEAAQFLAYQKGKVNA